MKINPVVNFRYQTLSKETKKSSNLYFEEELPRMSYTDLVFKASSKLKEPIIKNPIIKKINNKILSYIERLPESSKISKPVIMNFDDGIVGFVVDKTKKEGTFVSLKMVKGFEKIESFDSIKTPFMALEFTLNKNGQMTKGMYYDMPGRMNAIFTRDARNVRRIQYANAFYKPVAENENLWLKMVPEVGEYQYASSANKMEFRDNEIQEYFSELAKKNVSVFAK